MVLDLRDKIMIEKLYLAGVDAKEISRRIGKSVDAIRKYIQRNLKDLKDENNVDWFKNSIKATKANRQYCIDNKEKFKTYNENSWGLTACLSPKGYISCGAKPCGVDLNIENDGTVTPCGAIGSIVFTPKESISAMEYYYNNYPNLWGKYGFKDGYNLEDVKPWFAKEYIGIDKGIEVIMIENYLNGTI